MVLLTTMNGFFEESSSLKQFNKQYSDLRDIFRIDEEENYEGN